MEACIRFLSAALLTAACLAAAQEGAPGTVDVYATGMQFDMPDEIPYGWTTFVLHNQSDATHFALVEKLPDGLTLEQYHEGAVAFQALMDAIIADEPLEPAYELFPEWEVEYLGGPGLTSPGTTSQATVYLEPGSYVIECYVKTSDGQFHAYLGMVEDFVVTEEPSGAPAPTATLQMRISSTGGLVVDHSSVGGSGDGDSVPAGEHVVSVLYEDQAFHENFVGHDVNLVRLDDGADLSDIEAWMDWSAPTGLSDPAPATFLGGTQELPSAQTAFFAVTLEPGDYAWIAEVPNASGKGMLRTFTVSGPGQVSGGGAGNAQANAGGANGSAEASGLNSAVRLGASILPSIRAR